MWVLHFFMLQDVKYVSDLWVNTLFSVRLCLFLSFDDNSYLADSSFRLWVIYGRGFRTLLQVSKSCSLVGSSYILHTLLHSYFLVGRWHLAASTVYAWPIVGWTSWLASWFVRLFALSWLPLLFRLEYVLKRVEYGTLSCSVLLSEIESPFHSPWFGHLSLLHFVGWGSRLIKCSLHHAFSVTILVWFSFDLLWS